MPKLKSLCALTICRHGRTGKGGLVAPLVLDGAINGAAFLAYVEQMLCPTLRVGDVVICDNLGSHKVSGVREAIEACGASLLYLPPKNPSGDFMEDYRAF
jgi:transposase